MISKSHLIGGYEFQSHHIFISIIYLTYKRLFMICLPKSLLHVSPHVAMRSPYCMSPHIGMRSHVKKGIREHDIYYWIESDLISKHLCMLFLLGEAPMFNDNMTLLMPLVFVITNKGI